MMKNRLIGGSAALKVSGNDDQNPSYSNTKRSNQLGMFHVKGLFPTMPRKGVSVKGYILPAFDSSLSAADTYRLKSFEPYRDAALQNPTTGFDAFTSWFVPLGTLNSKGYLDKGGIYTYFGKSMSTFISPSLTWEGKKAFDVANNNIATGDPIQDLRIYISKSTEVPADYKKRFVDRPAYNANDPKSTGIWALPSTKIAYLVNAYCTGSNPYADDYTELKNRILLLTKTTFDDLVNDLDSYRPGNLKPIDPNYPDFLYGDVTNPERAVMFTSEPAASHISYIRLNFGNYNHRTGLACKQENLLNIPGVLEGRYDLTDATDIVKIPTYDEVVKLLVDEDTVPYDLIAKVCASKCDVFPENPALATEVENTAPDYEDEVQYTTPVQSKQEVEDDIPGIKEAPVWTPPAQQVQQPVQAAAVTNDSNLTDEELAEFARLHKIMHTTGGLGMAVPDITRYGDLFTKGGVKAIALVEKMM